MDPRYLNR